MSRKPRRRTPDAPRRLAFGALRAINAQGAYANLEIASRLDRAKLDARDAGFATELIAGTCRFQGTYDRIIEVASGRKLSSMQPAVLDALRLGTHQLLSMRVPVHAAVAATVDVAASEIGERVAGLTNAILRKVSAQTLQEWIKQLSTDEDELGALALRTHHPRWIVSAHVDLLGMEEAEEALAANNVSPVPTLVVRPGQATVSELGGTPTRWSRFGARRPGNPADVEAVRQGRAGVQDEGSQIVAAALADAPAPDGPWLDLSAGPGGKAALLAGLAIEARTRLLASEIAPHRARLVAQSLGCYSGDEWAPLTICADGRRPAWPQQAFARVMADVPCTGLGALRRRPEARWRRKPTDLDTLVPLQRQLLHTALESASDGGLVAYVTCSPHRQETVEVVERVLAETTANVEVVPAANRLPNVPNSALGNFVQLWGHRHETDAMFLAILRVRHR